VKKENNLSFELFENSPIEYRPVPFLFLNHYLEDEELVWQIKEIKDKGLRGFFMHPRSGLLTPYMSDEFRKKIKLMVETAEKYGIEAWLYDEDPYPSGAAGGKVIYQHPEFLSKKLAVETHSVEGKTTLKLDLPIGHIVKIFAISDKGEIVDLTEYAGPIRENWGYTRRYNTYYGAMRADTFPHWRSDTTGIKNCLLWMVPAGKWKIYAFIEKYEREYWGPWGGYVDLLNSKAVDDFINKTHEVYKKDIGKYFGKTVPGIFTDEPKWIGWLPWSSEFPEFFKKTKKYDILPVLYMLVEGDSEKERKIRFDYWDTLTRMLKQSFFDKIYHWCEKNKISFTGHVSPEEEPDLGVVYLGDLMQHAKSFQIPGTDIITSRLGINEFPIVNVGPKLISSVARQQKRKRVLTECFALEEWDFTLEKMKKIADFMMVLGVNFINPHGFYYSIDGHRKKEACPSQFYQTTYWQYYEQFSKYIGRVCYMLTRFDYACEFALLYPTGCLWQILPADRKKAKLLSDTFVFINNVLVHENRQFDFVDDIDFIDAKIENGKFTIGEIEYSSIVIPPLYFPSEPLSEKLKKFAEDGGKILFIGERIKDINGNVMCLNLPENMAQLEEEERKEIAQKIKNGVNDFVEPQVMIDGKHCDEVFVSVRKDKSDSIYFFVNLSEDVADFNVTLNEETDKEIWDPSSGKRFLLTGKPDNFNLVLEPGQSLFVVSCNERQQHLLGPSFSIEKEVVCKLDRWDFEVIDDNVLYLGMWNIAKKSPEDFFDNEGRYKEIGHPVLPPVPAGRIKDLAKTNIRWLKDSVFDVSYPSTLCYKTNFFCSGNPEKMQLVWEQSGIIGKYRIFIDNEQVPPDRIKKLRKYDAMNLCADITDFFKKGKPFYTPSVRTISVFVDVENPEQGLVEPMRIFGDFVVMKTGDMGMGAEIKAGKIKHQISCKSWTDLGYPFYSGSAIYTTTFNISKLEKARYFLRCDNLFDIAEIQLNGKIAGKILWNPKEIEITEFIKQADNHISMKITNSIYNLLEGKQKSSGILEPVKILKGK